MKKILFACIVLVSFNTVFSQNTEIERLEKIKHEFIIIKAEINDSIRKIDVQINSLKYKNEDLNVQNISLTQTTTRSEAKVSNKPYVYGDIIGYIPKGQPIIIYDYFEGYWLIEKDSIKGYIHDMYLVDNETMTKIKEGHDKNRIKKKYGEKVADKIFNHRIWIGMTKDMTKLSIGRPLDINRTTGSWGVHEQWVYKNRYLYFENGELKSWQD
ncbi:hypothetical protein [Dokdonia sp. Asnod1-B02]|uniref:hypothetical protein n=1 Tax=Dokdonia sp. Asnod1-B02 TaxID=3160573 RepID=UPI00386F3A7D